MEHEENKPLISKKGFLFDLLLTALFFVFMTSVCSGKAHAPASTENMRMLVGAFAAYPVTGLFWMALTLFRVTLIDQLRRRKNPAHWEPRH